MDREATIAWIEELAGAAPSELTDIAPTPGGPELSRVNPTCGDAVRFWLLVDDTRRIRLGGSVRGCSLSTAAAVLAVRALDGLEPVSAARLLDSAIEYRLTGDGPGPDGELGVLAGLELVPLRRRCVAFPWQLAADLLADVRPG